MMNLINVIKTNKRMILKGVALVSSIIGGACQLGTMFEDDKHQDDIINRKVDERMAQNAKNNAEG